MSAIINKVFEEYNSGELYRKIDPINSSYEDVEQISSLILLCYSYQWESDSMEKQNVLRTIEELAENKPIDFFSRKDAGRHVP